MNHPAASQPPETSKDPRRMGKLSRSYAQNRSLGVAVFMVIFLILYVALGGSSCFCGMAYHYSQWPIFWLCMAILIVALAATVYLSTPRWGGKLIERITERLYAGEGNAQLASQCTRSRRWIVGLLCMGFALCIQASVVLGFLDVFPQQYMQPISAIYFVPFLAALWLLQRPALGPIMLLWPALYALHAILIIAGVPILFVGRWDSLNMLIPTCGYGLLVSLIAHVYSRVALYRLRRTARESFPDETAEDRQP